jgi:ABC-2 type transport system ATP-binding protein
MVILLAALVLGGGAWFVYRRRDTAALPPQAAGIRPPPAGAVPSGSPPRIIGGRRVPARQLADGRIAVSGLTKEYRGLRAVDRLSFAAEPGRVTGFLGPNGAGKTTTLRMLLGLVEPTAGSATVGGRRYADLDQPIRRVGGVLEAAAAHKGRTGRNHLRVICQSAGIPLARADEVLELAGLTAAADRAFRGYSLGMRQRLGVAAALIGDPQVLILDEPTNGLDPEGIRWMRELLRALAGHGRTILVASHFLAEMQLLADDVIIVADGRLVTQGSVTAIVGSLAHGGRTLVRTPEAGKLAAALGTDVIVTPAGPGEVHITGADAVAIGDAAQLAGIAIHQLVTEHPDLEAAYLELTAGKAAIR